MCNHAIAMRKSSNTIFFPLRHKHKQVVHKLLVSEENTPEAGCSPGGASGGRSHDAATREASGDVAYAPGRSGVWLPVMESRREAILAEVGRVSPRSDAVVDAAPPVSHRDSLPPPVVARVARSRGFWAAAVAGIPDVAGARRRGGCLAGAGCMSGGGVGH